MTAMTMRIKLLLLMAILTFSSVSSRYTGDSGKHSDSAIGKEGSQSTQVNKKVGPYQLAPNHEDDCHHECWFVFKSPADKKTKDSFVEKHFISHFGLGQTKYNSENKTQYKVCNAVCHCLYGTFEPKVERINFCDSLVLSGPYRKVLDDLKSMMSGENSFVKSPVVDSVKNKLSGFAQYLGFASTTTTTTTAEPSIKLDDFEESSEDYSEPEDEEESENIADYAQDDEYY